MSGKWWLPCGTSYGTCTRIPHRAPTYGPRSSHGHTGCIVARLTANRTTSSTCRRMYWRCLTRCGLGSLGAGCANVVESLNAILNRAYNDHTARGGGGGMPGATALEGVGGVVLQAWEWWFLKFDLPLQNHGAPHTAPCTMANLMATQSAPPSSFSSPPPALVSPIHGPRHVEGPLGRDDESPRRPPGMRVLLVVCIFCSLIFWVVSINISRLVLTPATFNI